MRRAHDHYPTPAWVADALLPHIPRTVTTAIEAASGDGALARRLARVCGRVVANDIREDVDDEITIDSFCGDATDPSHVAMLVQCAQRYTERVAAITNPPYSLVDEWLLSWVATYPQIYHALLLRLDVLAGQARYAFWQRHPPTSLVILSSHPSFSDDGRTDASNYAWFIWDTQAQHAQQRLFWVHK